METSQPSEDYDQLDFILDLVPHAKADKKDGSFSKLVSAASALFLTAFVALNDGGMEKIASRGFLGSTKPLHYTMPGEGESKYLALEHDGAYSFLLEKPKGSNPLSSWRFEVIDAGKREEDESSDVPISDSPDVIVLPEAGQAKYVSWEGEAPKPQGFQRPAHSSKKAVWKITHILDLDGRENSRSSQIVLPQKGQKVFFTVSDKDVHRLHLVKPKTTEMDTEPQWKISVYKVDQPWTDEESVATNPDVHLLPDQSSPKYLAFAGDEATYSIQSPAAASIGTVWKVEQV